MNSHQSEEEILNQKEAQQRLTAPQYGLRGKPLGQNDGLLAGPDQVQERPHKKASARPASTGSPESPEAAQAPFWYPRDLDLPVKPEVKPSQRDKPAPVARKVQVTVRKKRSFDQKPSADME